MPMIRLIEHAAHLDLEVNGGPRAPPCVTGDLGLARRGEERSARDFEADEGWVQGQSEQLREPVRNCGGMAISGVPESMSALQPKVLPGVQRSKVFGPSGAGLFCDADTRCSPMIHSWLRSPGGGGTTGALWEKHALNDHSTPWDARYSSHALHHVKHMAECWCMLSTAGWTCTGNLSTAWWLVVQAQHGRAAHSMQCKPHHYPSVYIAWGLEEWLFRGR